MFKAKRKIVISSLVAIIGVLVGALSVSLTWFAKMNSIEDLEIGGSVLSQYFDSGTGTQADPFVITRPKHWENLVWLHNNVSNFYQAITDPEVEPGQQSDQGYFFQVGKQVNNQGEYYVYDYNDSGLINPQNSSLNSRVLNLKGLGSLIPIGCDTKPFLGVVNGHGITVSGFEVLGFEDVNYNLQHDSGELGFNDVGIFGYIGNDSAVQDIYFNDFTIHLANADAYRSNNVALHSNTHHTSTENGSPDTVFAGYIAGHMHYSSSVARVYINNCTIDGGTAAMSGFGYFGVVEQQNGEIKPTPLEEIQEIKQAGDGNNFGGSIDFNSVYGRLNEIFLSAPASNLTQYVDSEIIINNDKTGSSEIFSQTKANVVPWNEGIGYQYVETDAGGVFNFPDDNGPYADNYYQCLYGESSYYTKTVTTYTFTNEEYNCFFIQNGDNYLNHRYYAEIRAETNENNAAGWRFDNNYLYTMVFDEKYYLNVSDFVLVLGSSASTQWTQSVDDEIYTNINGLNYYLDFDGAWCISPYADRYTITDGNNDYLFATNSLIQNVSSESGATKFFFSDYNGSATQIGFNYNNRIYYLSGNGQDLNISTTPTLWYKDGTKYYITVQGVRHYLVCEGGNWYLRPQDGTKIYDGTNNYLNVTNGTNIGNNDFDNSIAWHFSNNSEGVEIYYYYGGQKNYLACNGNLSTSDSAVTWKRNGNALYTTYNNTDYYLTYDHGWKVTDLEFYTIHDSNGHYLLAEGNEFSSVNSYDATHFYFSNTNGTYPTGTINYVYDSTIYYLNYSITGSFLSLTSTTSSGATWSNDGNSIYCQNGNFTYYLEYNNDDWYLRKYVGAYYISDGTNYLALSNGTTLTNTTNRNNALLFTFSNTGTNPSGTINAVGTNYYLRNNNGTLQYSTTSSTWSNDGTNLYTGSTYYLVFSEESWKLSTSRYLGYYLSSGNYYLSLDGSDVVTTRNRDTIWVGNVLSNSGSSKIRAYGTNYYLTSETGSSNGYGYGLLVDDTGSTWSYNTRRLYYTSSYYYGIYFANNEFSAYRNSRYTNFTQLTFTSVSAPSRATLLTNNVVRTISTKEEVTMPTVSTSNYTCTENGTSSYSYTKDYSQNIFNGKLQNCEKDVQHGVRSGNPTYFPLRVDKVEGTNNYPSGWPASDKNTGYIISGAHLEQSTETDTSSQKWGDIRISGFAMSNINGSYTQTGTYANQIRTVYTADDKNGTNKVRTMTDSEKDSNFTHAKEELEATLRGQTHVYGMHFMDAAISKEHTIRANQVTILGQTYYNYELPEDSVDFNVYQKGHISFFAGNYFQNAGTVNNTFFSLHKIFRDENNDIEEIREITEIYAHATKPNRANYIYKFSDGTYTDPNGKYTGSTTRDSSYSSTPVFKTNWIKYPDAINNTNNLNRLFYFTIPCNSGEYALGSVPQRTGAYLCYLDIAANGGDTVLEYMKDPTEATTFDVDYRDATVSQHNHCILELGAEIQASANPDNLSIKVVFDNSATNANTPHPNGVYIIYVTNKTGVDLELSVLLVDDDADLYNDFGYAYQIVYTNQDHTNAIIYGEDIYEEYNELVDVPYWKRMAIFIIPSSGEAHESDYGVSS